MEGETALALEALPLLVERGALKFQQAWASVQRHAPSLPGQDLMAAAWLALLAHAHRDAEKHPEQFGRFQDVVWQATSHPSAQACPPPQRSIMLHVSMSYLGCSCTVAAHIVYSAAKSEKCEYPPLIFLGVYQVITEAIVQADVTEEHAKGEGQTRVLALLA